MGHMCVLVGGVGSMGLTGPAHRTAILSRPCDMPPCHRSERLAGYARYCQVVRGHSQWERERVWWPTEFCIRCRCGRWGERGGISTQWGGLRERGSSIPAQLTRFRSAPWSCDDMPSCHRGKRGPQSVCVRQLGRVSRILSMHHPWVPCRGGRGAGLSAWTPKLAAFQSVRHHCPSAERGYAESLRSLC